MTSTATPMRLSRHATTGRVIALVLVAAVGALLVQLRLHRGDDAYPVPAGARAGQLVGLEPCRYATEAGSLAADCGKLVVPENRADPRSRLIALPVTRIRARSGPAREPIFRLEGGPGVTNMTFPYASRFVTDRDVVLVGYRGVDGSSKLACPEVRDALRGSDDLLGAASFKAYTAAFRRCADRLRDDGVDLAGYSLPQRADDLEAARRALGYGRVDLLSESAGTRTAMIFAWRHPSSVARSVMVGVNPPGHFVWDPRDTDALLARYARLCERDAACRERTPDLVAALRDTRERLPDRWGPLAITSGNARLAAFYGLMNTTTAGGPLSGPLTIDAWQAARHGDASGLWLASAMGRLALPDAFVWGDLAAVGRIDVSAARRHFAGDPGRGTVLGDPGNEFLWAGGRLADAWPAGPDDDAYAQVRTSQVPTLLIGGELDGTTPPSVATRELLPHLPNGRQVVLDGLGHSEDFWNTQTSAGTHLVTTYLDTGRVDSSRYRPIKVDLSPAITQPMMGRIVAGALLALALVAVLGTAGLAMRVRRRGRIGTRAAVAVRTAGAALAGLGGWCAGALALLSFVPGVPLDAAGLSVACVAVPIALATALAGGRPGDRAWTTALALAGAVAGAWFGFGAAEGLAALGTAVLGGVAGANMGVLSRRLAVDATAAR